MPPPILRTTAGTTASDILFLLGTFRLHSTQSQRILVNARRRETMASRARHTPYSTVEEDSMFDRGQEGSPGPYLGQYFTR